MYYNDRLSKRDRAYLRLAANVALDSACKNRHGAVLVKGGRVIATAINYDRNHPTVFDNQPDIRAHAAVCAERAVLARVASATGAVMYVARVLRKDGSVSLSKPCARCDAAMADAGIKKVIYT